MKLLVATRSAGKEREVRQLLEGAGVEVVLPQDVGLAPTVDERRLELGDTFEQNARAKAEYFVKRSGLPTVADDSGLEVFSLGGEPGVRSRRWANAEGTELQIDAANNAYLLRRLGGAPEAKRRARYRCVLVYLPKVGAIPQVYEGACTGRILEAPQGSAGFGYDPLFHSDELEKSFGMATPEEKQRAGHRGKAFTAFIAGVFP
ncbi:MAG TPA: non-canonical purine NTP pyrophosphatase [Gemmatimonadales bacterium]